MEITIDLSNLLIKLKTISYTDYLIEPIGTDIYVTLFSRHEPVKYKIATFLSGEMLAHLTKYLIENRS